MMDLGCLFGVLVASGAFEEVVLDSGVFLVAMAGVVWVLIEQVVQLVGLMCLSVRFEVAKQHWCPVPWC